MVIPGNVEKKLVVCKEENTAAKTLNFLNIKWKLLFDHHLHVFHVNTLPSIDQAVGKQNARMAFNFKH